MASLDRALLSGEGQGPPGDERIAVAHHILRCTAAHECAWLEESRRHGLAALARFAPEAQYGRVYSSIFLGMTAMARGDIGEAADRYAHARQIAQRAFAADARLSVITDMLVMELDLERNRLHALEQRALRDLAKLGGTWIDVRQSALAVSAELTAMRAGPEAALELLANAIKQTRLLQFGADYRWFAGALEIDALVELGAVERAARLWSERELAWGPPEMLDLEVRSWRTVEALGGARVRLLAAQGDFGDAAQLADRLHEVASARGLVRTAMRARALGMAATYHAGATAEALRRLQEFLALARHADYFRPLVRCREVAVDLVGELLRTAADDDLRRVAMTALAQLGQRPETSAAEFSPREMDVLAELIPGRRNKEIATRLGISDDGVRFHLKNIYRKLGVNKRAEAIRRAREL